MASRVFAKLGLLCWFWPASGVDIHFEARAGADPSTHFSLDRRDAAGAGGASEAAPASFAEALAGKGSDLLRGPGGDDAKSAEEEKKEAHDAKLAEEEENNVQLLAGKGKAEGLKTAPQEYHEGTSVLRQRRKLLPLRVDTMLTDVARQIAKMSRGNEADVVKPQPSDKFEDKLDFKKKPYAALHHPSQISRRPTEMAFKHVPPRRRWDD